MDNTKDSIAKQLLEVQHALGWMDIVIGSIDDAVYVTDRDSRIVFANQYFSDVLNIPRVFLLGEILSDVFDVELDKKLTAELNYIGVQNYEEAEIFIWKTLNEKRTFRISKKYIKTTKQIVYLAKDITREQELLAMKNSFINLASHQLRTPMTSIMLNSHMLKDFYAGDETMLRPKKLAETISQSAERMTRLIDDILNITKIQNESPYRTNFEHINIKDVVELIHNDVKSQLHSKKLIFSVKIPKSLPVFKSDRSAVHEIISNLVTNAVQYTPDAGTISVSAKLTGAYITIAVKDTGIGIPAQAVSQIYDQFARADNAFAVFNEGTGLGLYLVKLLLMKIGGTIECDSKLNAGTTFSVKIPYIK